MEKKKSTCGKVAARPRCWRLRILRCRIMTLWHKDFNFSSHCPGSLLEETPRALKYSKSRTDHLPPANCATADHLSPSKQTDTKAGLRFFIMNVQERSCTVAAPKTGVTSECIQHFLSASSYKHERGN